MTIKTSSSSNADAAWSSRQYSTFEKERTRPVRDLVAAIDHDDVDRAVDLGCGPGNSTEVLAERFSKASVSGLDSSEDMVEAARKRLPGVAFELADIGQWNPGAETFDVILANASLQWVPDHPALYPRLVSYLAPGGRLAIQTPDNLEEPAHRTMREVAASGPWRGLIGEVKLPPRHHAQAYYEMLMPHCTSIDIWRTTYFHRLANAQAIVEWFKGSSLRPYLAQLDARQGEAFLAAYRAEIERAYPALDDGTVLLPFPRLFIVGTR
jgi:trans-aconitate 2-methyltransferase